MGARGWLISSLAAAAAMLLLGRAVTALFVDHAWFTSMGAPALFWEQVIDTTLLQGGAWMLGSVFAFLNLHTVRRTIVAVAVPSRVANLEVTAMISGQRLLAVTVVLSMMVGLALSLPLTNWVDVALVRHGFSFGEIEGILGRDLGFYVYWLPVEETLYLWSLVNVVSITALVVVLYALTRSLRMEGRRVAASTHVRRHLSTLGALVLFLLAWSYRLDAFDLLRQGSGPDGLFLKVDHRVTLRMDYVLSFASALAALVVLRTGWVGQVRAAFLTLTVILVAAAGLRHVAPAVLARGDLLGEPARRDLDYVLSRALYSRRAFDVEGIQFVADDSVARTELRLRRVDIPARVSLWDHAMLTAALSGDGVSGTGVATSAQRAGDAPTAEASAAARDTGMIDAAPMSWTVIGDRISALLVKRPIGDADGWRLSSVDLTQPLARDSVLDLVPPADDNASDAPLVGPGVRGVKVIDGDRGKGILSVSVASLMSRIAHAWALRDMSLLGADSTSADPRLVLHRDIRDRVRRLAPVFEQGQEVLPLLHEGRLYWAVHLYSASDRYPLSQRWQLAGGIFSYFHLAATAVVESTSGRVLLVTTERPDPLTRTWQARLPGLFARPGELPDALLAQLPPPSESAIAQIKTFSRYGSRREGVVLRQLPESALVGGGPVPQLLTDGAARRLAWSVPLIDAGDQIGGIMTATGGRARLTWWDSAASPRQRWITVTARLQSTLDSARRAAPEAARRESRLHTSRVTSLMTAGGPMFVQSLLWNRGEGNGGILRVAATDGIHVTVGRTLGEALGQMGDLVMPTVLPAGASADIGAPPSARRWYAMMREALRRGDWVRFGAAFDSLGRVLERPPQ
jgi:uncharacterized membrane protein (UPF0182 family)